MVVAGGGGVPSMLITELSGIDLVLCISIGGTGSFEYLARHQQHHH